MKRICPLCQNDEEVVSSHIIPRFFWRHVKEEGKYHIISSNGNSPLKGQRELKEKLLCSKCDNLTLQSYETYLAKLVYGGHEADTITNTKQALHLRGLDYKRLKRGILSILWRMHHSSLQDFKTVRLEATQEEIIRSYVNAESDLPDTAFPILVAAPLFGDAGGGGACIMGPYIDESYGCKVWNQLLQGMIFRVFLSHDFSNPEIKDFVLNSSGEMVILKGEFTKFPFLMKFLERALPSKKL
jgi:hypothetical protein